MDVQGHSLDLHKGLYWQREKVSKISSALDCDPVDVTTLRTLATSLGGLIDNRLRKKAWPKLVGISVYHIPDYNGPSLAEHKDRAQVLLDVNRCGKRVPKQFSDEGKQELQEQLTRVILRLLAENSELHYYQGLHDVVLSLLLVVGEKIAYAVMTVLVQVHIRDYLDVNMDRTKVIIRHLQSLLALEDPRLEQFISRSECAYYFSLSWLITWFGHVIFTHDDVYRLMDLFLASHPLMPVYLAGAIVLVQRSEVLSLECEMSAVHGQLSKLPPDVNYESLITTAVKLYNKHSPKSLIRQSGVKLSHSSMLSKYSSFLNSTKHQRPDHILKTLPSPPTHTSWWEWLNPFSRYFLSLTAPVILAILAYFIYGYLNTQTNSINVLSDVP